MSGSARRAWQEAQLGVGGATTGGYWEPQRAEPYAGTVDGREHQPVPAGWAGNPHCYVCLARLWLTVNGDHIHAHEPLGRKAEPCSTCGHPVDHKVHGWRIEHWPRK